MSLSTPRKLGNVICNQTETKPQSDYQKVLEFTSGSGANITAHPAPMTKEEVKFLIGMCVSELVEMAQTVCDTASEAKFMVADSVHIDLKPSYVKPENDLEIMADQADAAVDCWYYLLNGFCKKHIDLSRVFDVVHSANMAKKWSDGTFHRREDGKILKPDGWSPPDIVGEIEDQYEDSF